MPICSILQVIQLSLLQVEDEDGEAEDNEPDSGAHEKSKVTNGSKESTGSTLPSKRKRDTKDDAEGDN